MKRLLAGLACLLLITSVAACGSRTTDSGSASGDDELDGTTVGTEPAADGALSPASPQLGTIDNPCGGDASGSVAGDVPGVTDDTIRIGVISDRANPAVPLPTVGIEEAVQAFVDLCNEAGGIDGRQLELETYDSMITATEDATRAACRDDLFALVGSGSVQDQIGAETREGCGLPEIAAYAATSTRQDTEDFFLPETVATSTQYNTAGCRYIAEQFPDSVDKVGLIYTDIPAASARARQFRDACTASAGFDYVVDRALRFGDTNYGPLVDEMKQEGVKVFEMVSSTSEMLGVLREAELQGLDFDVINLTGQYYEPAVAEEPAADGALVQVYTTPFAEADDTPILRLYEDQFAAAGGTDSSSLTVQAFSAAMLFATAVDGLDGDLTQAGLVEALEQIDDWDGGGLHMVGHPGTGEPADCLLYVEVQGGEFARKFPDAGFACEPDAIYTADQPYGS